MAVQISPAQRLWKSCHALHNTAAHIYVRTAITHSHLTYVSVGQIIHLIVWPETYKTVMTKSLQAISILSNSCKQRDWSAPGMALEQDWLMRSAVTAEMLSKLLLPIPEVFLLRWCFLVVAKTYIQKSLQSRIASMFQITLFHKIFNRKGVDRFW